MVAFFNEQSGDDCVFCADDRITLTKAKKNDYEEIEDTGCVGGACTL